MAEVPTAKELINMSVSVVIPCFNAERWVNEAIQSCIDQTINVRSLLSMTVRPITAFMKS
jgi:spore coat protein CotF